MRKSISAFFLILGVLLLCSFENPSLHDYHSGCKQPKQGAMGLPGPQGPQGPAGAIGPPGAFSSYLSVFRNTNPIGGIPAAGPGGVPPAGAIVFDQLAIPTQGPALTYNAATGTVTFLETGFYEVTFGASMDVTNVAGGLALQLAPAGIYPTSPMNPAAGVVPGSETNITISDQMTTITVIVQVTEIGQTMQLVNGNNPAGGTINLHAANTNTDLTPVLAYLIVVKLQ